MCFMNCPYEDVEGECTNSKMMGTEHSFCREEDEEEEDGS
jgi:hypothetical protein